MKDSKGHGSNKRGERMPIPGHPYHGKSDEELRYIAKDAHEAGRNAHEMGDMKGVNKYADQVADASTVLGYRGRSGSGPISNSMHAVTDHPKSSEVPTHDATPGRNEHGSRHGYNPESVNNAIRNNRTGKIGGKEASMIHRLLKGR